MAPLLVRQVAEGRVDLAEIGFERAMSSKSGAVAGIAGDPLQRRFRQERADIIDDKALDGTAGHRRHQHSEDAAH